MAELTIDQLGRRGDGIAYENGKPVFVPFSLPGERVLVSGTGPRRAIVEIVERSSCRVEPVCGHFGECGGCQTQHADTETYQAWKKALVEIPIRKAGLDALVDPLVSFDVGSRRKCVFSAKNTNQGVILGFSEKAGDHLIAIDACPVLACEITGDLDAIRDMVASLPQSKRPFRLSVLSTKNGLDISIEGTLALKSNQKEVLVRKALAANFARLACDDEILIEKRKPQLQMGTCAVVPPPGAFVQAVQAAEQHMASLVCNHLEKCKSVADLFSGIGTFALRLAEKSTVWAVEENAPALAALDRAWRETGGKLKQVKTEVRNLDRRPVSFQELKKIDGLVFDPPRAGAEMQANQIAKSKVKRVAAVSCNPVTLTRDLQILVDGGFRIERIVPVDQFIHTPHVEVVALLER